MEKYIQKLEARLDKKHSPQHAAKIKKRFLIVGGVVLSVGLAGILAAMICFAIFFVQGDTDTALTCWLIAVPFVIVFIAGAVVARVGDKLKNNALQKKEKQASVDEDDLPVKKEENKAEDEVHIAEE